MYETGRIGTTPEATPTAIEPQEELGTRTEKSVQTAADKAQIDTPPPKVPSGVVNRRILDQEIETHFAALENCRIDAARNKRITPNEIIGTTLTLRWTILQTGDTAETLVVASRPVDLEVMDCVKAAMSQWSFTAPRGGPVRLDRMFTFRPLP